MIIKREGETNRSQSIFRACKRFIGYMGLTILESKDLFTIKEAKKDGETVWFDKNHMNCEDYDTFIRMAAGYARTYDRVPLGKVIVHIACPNCRNCQMTPKQIGLNVVRCGIQSFLICNNCGEIMKIDDIMEIKDDTNDTNDTNQ